MVTYGWTNYQRGVSEGVECCRVELKGEVGIGDTLVGDAIPVGFSRQGVPLSQKQLYFARYVYIFDQKK